MLSQIRNCDPQANLNKSKSGLKKVEQDISIFKDACLLYNLLQKDNKSSSYKRNTYQCGPQPETHTHDVLKVLCLSKNPKWLKNEKSRKYYNRWFNYTETTKKCGAQAQHAWNKNDPYHSCKDRESIDVPAPRWITFLHRLSRKEKRNKVYWCKEQHISSAVNAGGGRGEKVMKWEAYV
jgi:hypothetical protein